PGVDTIWRQIYPGKAHGFFARFATAAAIRNKRPEALCESFNVYTYFITPEVMHYVGNDLLVKGINRILPMPYLYSDRKERKISCSTDFSPRNPIWKSLRALNEFWRWAGRFDTAALTPDVWVLARTKHPCPEDPQNIQGYPACHAEADQKVRELCIQLDRLGIFYRFADEKDLAGKERPKLLILPFETAVNDAASFPEIICGVPEDPAPYARVRILKGNGCFIHPVIRPEGEALMVFNPGKEMVDFVFESEKNYAELLPPDKTPSLLYPLRQEGKTITVPLCPGNLRILLVNGKQECLPKQGEPEKRLIDWQISRIERLMMSACSPTYFKKEKGGTPLPSSGKYTDIEPDFSGLLHLTGSLFSRGGKVLIELHNVQHSAALSVNGRPCGLRAFAPWVFEAELAEGENRLELEIASSGGNEFFRCFKEELEPRNWKNSYARRFTLYERDDRECGVDKTITLYPLFPQ
ncbi:MAG: hypothetical protein IKC65_09050, partial [Lentisphaeria bacterium]|nr:hypothetical protein [Lentisphaeria bacterium]